MPNNSLQRRRGSLTSFLVAALAVLLGVLALAIDQAFVSMAHTELARAADAAALAGARALADDDDLRTPCEPSDYRRRAALASRRFARLNVTLCEPTELDDRDDACDADIRIGRLICSHTGRGTLDDQFAGAPDTVQVIARRTAARHNPVAMLLGSCLGIYSADVVAAAQATLDDNICGFKPIRGIPVPLVPLAIQLGDSACERPDNWASAIAMRRGPDQFGFDQKTGQIVRRGDGIPELILVFDRRAHEQREPNAAVVRFGSRFDADTLARQLRDGLSEIDLKSRGGSIELPPSGSLDLEAQLAIPGELAQACEVARCQPRVWPLFAAMTPAGKSCRSLVSVVGFVGARIVDFEHRDRDRVAIRIQPCFVVTRSAIAAPGRVRHRNSYVRKISITG